MSIPEENMNMDIREILKSKYFVRSILITPLLFFVALSATGGGDGTFIPATLFFPYAMLLPCFSQNISIVAIIAIACVQIPFYGILLSIADQKDERALFFVKIGIVVTHFITVALCFILRLTILEAN
jgi:hypothetical protein